MIAFAAGFFAAIIGFAAGFLAAVVCLVWDGQSGNTLRDPEPWIDRHRT